MKTKLSTFKTVHKKGEHSATINGKNYGPFETEIELVQDIPVKLKNCECIATETVGVGKFPEIITHTWEIK